MKTQRQLQESAIRKIHNVLLREATRSNDGVYAYGVMNTPDGKISGDVRFIGMWNKFIVNVDGSEYGKHNDAASAVDELKRTGFKKVEVFKTPITIAQLNTRRKRDGVV